MSQSAPYPLPFPRLFAHPTDPDEAPRWPGFSRIPLGWRLFGILLMCLIPRIWMACQVRSVCFDSYYYISIAAACQQGDWAEAFTYLNLNIYPLILMGMNSLGFDWLIGGKIWSIVISSLAVLPLFGWVRRMFSDQVAWAACFLYSLHAEFVEFSMEPVRDPTFWFLFNLTIYTTWRAISEAKFRWFLAGGFSLALAIHTRSEGWLLVIPFAMWLVRRLCLKTEPRLRLLGGSLVWIAVTPLLIVLINLTVLRGESEWQFGRLNHFAVGWKWVEKQLKPAPPAITSPKTPQANPDPAPASLPANENAVAITPTTEVSEPIAESTEASSPLPEKPTVSAKFYFKEMASSLEQINLGLLVFGLCWLWRGLWDWDRGALFLMSFAFAGAVWILYEQSGVLNGRYFFPIYLALMPYFATGLLVVWNALWAGAVRLNWSWLKPHYTAIFIFWLAIGLGWVDALTTFHTEREQEVDLGEWLTKNHGPFQFVATDPTGSRAGYHAYRQVPGRLHNWATMEIQFPEQPYDMLILTGRCTPPECRMMVHDAATRMGLKQLTVPKHIPASDLFLIYLRESPPKVARDPKPLREAVRQ